MRPTLAESAPRPEHLFERHAGCSGFCRSRLIDIVQAFDRTVVRIEREIVALRREPVMSVATELPPEVYIPPAARRRTLRVAGPAAAAGYPASTRSSNARLAPRPAAPAAAAIGAGVVDLDRWRHQLAGAEEGEGQRGFARPGSQRFAGRTLADPAGRLSRESSTASRSATLRLTRRGLILLGVGSVLLTLAVVAIAWLSAPSDAGVGSAAGSSAGSVVTVHSGDSLWSLATQVAPHRDPRAEIVELRKLNDLADDVLTPGQRLRVR